MNIHILQDTDVLGHKAAEFSKAVLDEAIQNYGSARLLVATGASQFPLISALLKLDIDWSRVEIFHLDEYIGLDITHKASFRKLLKDYFVSHISPLAVHYLHENNIDEVSARILERQIDLGFIGIGENAHIAFNDPPADFDCEKPYIVVNLDEQCKRQQVGEGWFDTIADVPPTAVTITVRQILNCKTILSFVPDGRKALAVRNTLAETANPEVPATALKLHDDWHLYLDNASAAMIIPMH